MYKIKNFLEKYKVILVAIIIFIAIISSICIIGINNLNNETVEPQILKVDNNIEEEKIEIKKLKVDIKGFIKKPGVYELEENSRIIDVINMAGGLIEGANTEYINLSKKIVDEMIIIIYSNKEVEKYKETEKEIIYIEYECVCPDNINDSCINENDIVNTNGTKKEETEEQLISINTATIEELMKLSGIGESKAKSIIEYRKNNGEFKTLEDIMNVSGIGESAYSKIKDYIKL